MKMEIEWCEYPWPHIIIDNYLRADQYNTISDRAFTICPHNIGDPVQREMVMENQIDPLWKAIGQHTWKEARGTDDVLAHYTRTRPMFHHPMHCDAPFKLLSAILYLGDDNTGTMLMDSQGNPRKYVEWKPNRMLMFHSIQGVTFHDYQSDWRDRHTLNLFVVNHNQINNSMYKRSVYNAAY